VSQPIRLEHTRMQLKYSLIIFIFKEKILMSRKYTLLNGICSKFAAAAAVLHTAANKLRICDPTMKIIPYF
jgi:hypothetical protein